MIRRNSGFSFEQKFGLSCFVAVALLCLFALVIKATGGVNWKFSEGSRSGVVQKISKKGIFWKTWEGELNLGYNQSHVDENGHQSIVPAIFYFSVSDDRVAAIVKEAEVTGSRLTLDYNQYFLRGWDKGGTSYDITAAVSKGRTHER